MPRFISEVLIQRVGGRAAELVALGADEAGRVEASEPLGRLQPGLSLADHQNHTASPISGHLSTSAGGGGALRALIFRLLSLLLQRDGVRAWAGA